MLVTAFFLFFANKFKFLQSNCKCRALKKFSVSLIEMNCQPNDAAKPYEKTVTLVLVSQKKASSERHIDGLP